MPEELGIAMVSTFNRYVYESSIPSTVAFGEHLTPDALLQWLAEREAWNFREHMTGTKDGFIMLNVDGTEIAMGTFCHMTGKPSFAAFFVTNPGPRPAQAFEQIDAAIRGGSILLDRMQVSRRDGLPSEITAVLQLGHGFPITG